MPVRLPPSRKNRTPRAPGVRPIRKRATPPGADRLRAECWASEFALRERRNIQLRKIHRIRPPRQRHPKLLHPREQEVVQGKPKPETLIAPETIHEAKIGAEALERLRALHYSGSGVKGIRKCLIRLSKIPSNRKFIHCN